MRTKRLFALCDQIPQGSQDKWAGRGSVTRLSTDTYGEERLVGSGSGFVHREFDKDFLITNWHVVTGRSPENPSHMIPGYPESPTSFRLHLPTSDNPNHFLPSAAFPLYVKGRPNWIQTNFDHTTKRIDLVALPFGE
jgi:hypothetical protein